MSKYIYSRTLEIDPQKQNKECPCFTSTTNGPSEEKHEAFITSAKVMFLIGFDSLFVNKEPIKWWSGSQTLGGYTHNILHSRRRPL